MDKLLHIAAMLNYIAGIAAAIATIISRRKKK